MTTIVTELIDDSNKNEILYLRQQIKDLVLLALEKKGKISFDDLPEVLRNDRDIVLGVVLAGSNAEEWYKLPQRWKDDAEIACAVFAREITGFFSTDPPKEGRSLKFLDLPYHLCIDKKVVLHFLRSDCSKWENIPMKFKSDADILATAFFYEKIDFDDIPIDLKRSNREIASYGVSNDLIQVDECTCFDRDDFRVAIQDGELEWRHLPQTLKNDYKFAVSISLLKLYNDSPRQIMEQIPKIRSDKSYWRRILSSPYNLYHSLKDLIKDFAPVELCSDHDLMLEICSKCTHAFSLIDENLLNNRDFLEKVLRANVNVLQLLPHQTQILHRDLVFTALHSLDKEPNIYVESETSNAIYPPFWEDCKFIMTWVKAGYRLPFISDDLSKAWTSNRALCLAGLICNGKKYRTPLTYARSFIGEAQFMAEVLDHHPDMYGKAKGAAVNDPTCMTIAFAASLELTTRKMKELHFNGKDDEIKRYVSFLRHKLDPYKVFVECILGNMLSTQSIDVTGSNLTLLNQGIETSINYRRRLVEYLGIPTGRRLLQLLQAERNVLEATAPFEDF